MYAFLRGKLASSRPPHVVLDVVGVGYQVMVPLSLFGKLPKTGSELFLHTSYVVRETGHQLFGFETLEERDLFEQLTAVSGVGPKLSLSLIGHLSPAALHAAVLQGDWAAIAATPGVGKKTAERLIIELRGKVQLTQEPAGSAAGDAVAALMNLGYSAPDARKAINKALKETENEVSALIASALKQVCR